ncbi:MAG: GNAT family N-acetyltransferase [Janthinobacterium lividum]
MSESPTRGDGVIRPDVVFRSESPGSPAGRRLRAEYWDDVTLASGLSVVGGPPESDLSDLVAPHGGFFIAHHDGRDVGCVGVRTLDGGDVEVKRLYVSPAARGLSLGRRLLTLAEDWARERDASRLVLDTRAALVVARGLYASAGFVEVEPYNDNGHAEVWYAKPLEG